LKQVVVVVKNKLWSVLGIWRVAGRVIATLRKIFSNTAVIIS